MNKAESWKNVLEVNPKQNEWQGCYSIVVSYCSNISERKSVFCGKHSTRVKRRFVRCVTRMEGIRHLCVCEHQMVKTTKEVRFNKLSNAGEVKGQNTRAGEARKDACGDKKSIFGFFVIVEISIKTKEIQVEGFRF